LLLWGVDADSNNAGSGLGEIRVMLRQADQLAAAIRSPVSSEEEKDHGGVEMVCQLPAVSVLIDQRKIRRLHYRSFDHHGP